MPAWSRLSVVREVISGWRLAEVTELKVFIIVRCGYSDTHPSQWTLTLAWGAGCRSRVLCLRCPLCRGLGCVRRGRGGWGLGRGCRAASTSMCMRGQLERLNPCVSNERLSGTYWWVGFGLWGKERTPEWSRGLCPERLDEWSALCWDEKPRPRGRSGREATGLWVWTRQGRGGHQAHHWTSKGRRHVGSLTSHLGLQRGRGAGEVNRSGVSALFCTVIPDQLSPPKPVSLRPITHAWSRSLRNSLMLLGSRNYT